LAFLASSQVGWPKTFVWPFGFFDLFYFEKVSSAKKYLLLHILATLLHNFCDKCHIRPMLAFWFQ